METKEIIKKEVIKKVENICEKAFGVNSKDINISTFMFLRFSLEDKNTFGGYYLNLEIIDNYPIVIDCEQYNSIFDNIHKYTDNNNNDKYLSKLLLIDDVIKFYKFNENTKFILKIVFDDGYNKILKKDDYFNCIYYFMQNDFNEIYKDKKYNIKIIDNKENYRQILFEKK